MKNISNCNAPKYSLVNYIDQGDNIYKINGEFVTSLRFQQEPDLGEGTSSLAISQYPLEDILDRFCVYVSDFYKMLNIKDAPLCHLEFSSTDIEDIRRLRGIIGKHVYNKTISEGGKSLMKLVVE